MNDAWLKCKVADGDEKKQLRSLAADVRKEIAHYVQPEKRTRRRTRRRT